MLKLIKANATYQQTNNVKLVMLSEQFCQISLSLIVYVMSNVLDIRQNNVKTGDMQFEY